MSYPEFHSETDKYINNIEIHNKAGISPYRYFE